MNSLPRAQWSSYRSYILVTLGAIVGLGNIFSFPFLVITYGGLFVLFFVLSELLLSIPLLFAELLTGRRGKQNPVGSISILAMESGASLNWRFIGWLSFVILVLTLSYYPVTVGFPLAYLFHTVKTLTVGENSTNLISSFASLEICFLIFLALTIFVVIRGINRGLEKISSITVPVYFVILGVLAIYASFQGSFLASVSYLFHVPDDQSIWPVMFAALAFAFFKLNVGMGSMIVYGSYLPYSVPLGQSTALLVILDAVVSLLSYFIICPLLLQSQLFAQGAQLSFQNILFIFTEIPNGLFIASLFFFAAIVAAWTPTIAIAESAAVTLIERFQISRLQAALIVGLSAAAIGTIVVLSITDWPSIILFNQWSIAGFIQNVSSDMATPLSALFMAIFIGWIVKRNITSSELAFKPALYTLWRTLIAYLAPLCIIAVFLGVGFN